MDAWGPTALLPIFQIFGVDYKNINYFSSPYDKNSDIDGFTKLDIQFDTSVASIKVGTTIKSESELIISGSKGYIYVPSPWWKMDYFEIRYENFAENKRYVYQVEGEGIRYELVQFASAIRDGKSDFYISREITKEIANVIEKVNSSLKRA